MLIRAKISPEIIHQKRKVRGMRKCSKICHGCPYVQERKSVKQGKFIWSIIDQVDCESENILYLIQCNKTNYKLNKYVGKSERTAKQRISRHRAYIFRNEKKHGTGEHLNQARHSLAKMKFTILEIARSKDPL